MKDVNILTNFNLSFNINTFIETYPELQGTEYKLGSLKTYINPLIYWGDIKVDYIKGSHISFNNERFSINSAYVAQGLVDCKKATLMAITIGKDLPEYSRRCVSRKELWEGTIADLFGSYAVEALAEKFHQYLAVGYRQKGLFSSARFSPGYGDWDLSDQDKIISFLKTEPEISVNSNHLLQPVKSITAMIGWSVVLTTGKYPEGDKKKGLCSGAGSCAHCRTWACMKGKTN